MRNYGGSALMLLVTMAAAVGSYTINLKVSGERAAVEQLRRQIGTDARDMRNLQAELRTRARLPEMQRWNDNVLQMSAPSEQQYLRSPLQLASFGAEPAAPEAVEPAVRFAVTAPAAADVAAATVVRTASVQSPVRGPSAGSAAAAAVRGPAVRGPAVRDPAARDPAVRAPAPAAALVRVSYPATPRRTPPLASMIADIDASLDARYDTGAAPTGVPRDLLPGGGQ